MNIVKETENHYYITCTDCARVLQYPKRVKPSDSQVWIIREPRAVTCTPCHFTKENN